MLPESSNLLIRQQDKLVYHVIVPEINLFDVPTLRVDFGD